jgi:2-keto-4-pentenoate hydratase/2-oxohepta-3-ene-1,7-dioic acid hydratase in catechol pathway
VIATTQAIPDPQTLAVKTTIDGQLMQDSNTDDMVFSCAKIVSFLSQDTTLLPGTVICTGTPFVRHSQSILC